MFQRFKYQYRLRGVKNMPDQAQVRSDVPVRRYEYEDTSVIVADLGPVADDVSVEVLEDVAIVVLARPEGDAQFEIDLPEEGVSNTFITNGVLTFEVNES